MVLTERDKEYIVEELFEHVKTGENLEAFVNKSKDIYDKFGEFTGDEILKKVKTRIIEDVKREMGKL